MADHNRVLIDNTGTGSAKGSFDIGGFTLLEGGEVTEEIGSQMHFEDDGPAISQAAPTDTILLNTQDADTIGPNTDSDGQSFAAAFTIGSSSGGADGAGAPTWSYALSVGSPGMDSGLKSHGATIYLYLINSGKVVGSTATSAADVLPGNTVFDVEVDATGYVTLDQMTVIDHGIPGSLSDLQAVLENGKIYLTATALITDFDGDTASSAKTLDLGGNIKFDDALPFAVLAVPTAMTLLLTQDRDTLGGTDTAAVVYNTAFSEAGSDAGADTGGSINKSLALKVSNQGVDSGLTSHSATIYLYLIDSQTVVGSTSAVEGDINASNTVFSILLESGSVKLEQMQAIDHELPGDTSNYEVQKAFIDDGKLWLEVTLSVTDFDNDVATVTKEFDLAGHMAFADDGPAAFSPASVSLQNTGTATATGDLHTGGDIADTIGADVEGSSIFVDGNSLDNYLYKTDGTTLLRSGGEKIVLSGFGTDTLTATTENTHQTVFTATLLFGSDQYTIDFDKAIDDGSGISFLGAAPVKSGNPTYNIIDNVGGTTLDLLFSGTKNGAISSVNVSTTGAGVANQTMNAGESLRIDFGHDMLLTGSPNGSDFTSGSHQIVNGYSFLVSQNTPSGTTATAYIKVYDADNDKVLTGDPDDTVDTITQVKVNGILIYDTDPNTTLQPITVNGKTVTAFAYDGGVIITGLNEGATGDGTGGDDPRITVYTADGFNRVETTNYAGQTVNNTVLGGTDFDIGPAGVEQSVQGTEFAFQLPVQTVDYDGDLSPVELIGVNVTPV